MFVHGAPREKGNSLESRNKEGLEAMLRWPGASGARSRGLQRERVWKGNPSPAGQEGGQVSPRLLDGGTNRHLWEMEPKAHAMCWWAGHMRSPHVGDPYGEKIHMKTGPRLQSHGRERIHRPRYSVSSLHWPWPHACWSGLESREGTACPQSPSAGHWAAARQHVGATEQLLAETDMALRASARRHAEGHDGTEQQIWRALQRLGRWWAISTASRTKDEDGRMLMQCRVLLSGKGELKRPVYLPSEKAGKLVHVPWQTRRTTKLRDIFKMQMPGFHLAPSSTLQFPWKLKSHGGIFIYYGESTGLIKG